MKVWSEDDVIYLHAEFDELNKLAEDWGIRRDDGMLDNIIYETLTEDTVTYLEEKFGLGIERIDGEAGGIDEYGEWWPIGKLIGIREILV